jgi:arabinofuranosyltransferase
MKNRNIFHGNHEVVIILGKMKTKIIFVVLILMLIALLAVHIRMLAGLTDDAYISFRYSKNLAQGQGLRWNPGGEKVEGYTNFSWVLIGTLGFLLLPDLLPQLMSGLGIIFLLATIWIFLRMLALQFPGKRIISLSGAFFLAASGPLILWSTSGLETMMFAMLTAAGFLAFLQYLQTGKAKYYNQVWIVSLLLFLTRPDGIIFAAVMGCYFLLWQKGLLRRDRLLPFLTFYLIPFLAYNTWRIAYFGSWLPNTFYAKATGAALNQFKKGGLYLFNFSMVYLLPLIPLVLYLLICRKRTAAESSHFKIVSLMFLGTFTLYILLVGGDYMAMYRFFVPLLPLLYLLIAAEFIKTAGSGKNVAGWFLLAAAVLITFLPSTPLDRLVWGGNHPYQYGCYEGYRTEQWYLNRYITIGKLFGQIKRNAADSIVIPAIGAVGYYSGMNVIDYYGLTEPRIARMAKKTFSENFPGHEKTDIDFILSKKPNYLMGYKRFSSNRVGWDHPMFESQYIKGDMKRRALIARDYRVRNVRVRDPLNRESGYLAFLERKSDG